jgi:hypothetical protein
MAISNTMQSLQATTMRFTRFRFSLRRLIIVVTLLGLNFGLVPWPASGVFGAALALPLILSGGTLFEWRTITGITGVLAGLLIPAVATNCRSARVGGLPLTVNTISISVPALGYASPEVGDWTESAPHSDSLDAESRADEDQAQSPDRELPPHITRLTLFGERADFSHDGKRVLFLEKTFGDVYEVDLETKTPRLLTGHYPHHGYTRALYLANGDILLSGPERLDPEHPADARVQCYLSVLDKTGTKRPVALGTKCSEGPAVSRKRLHIAWTHVAAQYPTEMPQGSSRIYEADVVYEGGMPKLAKTRLVLDSRDLPFRCTLEAQNFRPPDERELTFSAYGHQGTDSCGLDLETKRVMNYSDAPGQYDEPEGILPDGRSTLVESDREGMSGRGPGHVDIWKLSLDGKKSWERLTYFNKYEGYKASNPVVSDDGKLMAFQMAKSRDAAGVGYGIFLFDLEKASPRR